MTITFTPLAESYFPLLLKWLETPHVKAWWDHDVTYDINLVKEKFGRHIHGDPISNASNKLTYAYVITAGNKPIGYIQAYNAKSFAEENGIDAQLFPDLTCGIDLFIGEENFLNKGLGSVVLEKFWQQLLQEHFEAALVDPNSKNINAIKAFTKAGFEILKEVGDVVWMIKNT